MFGASAWLRSQPELPARPFSLVIGFAGACDAMSSSRASPRATERSVARSPVRTEIEPGRNGSNKALSSRGNTYSPLPNPRQRADPTRGGELKGRAEVADQPLSGAGLPGPRGPSPGPDT